MTASLIVHRASGSYDLGLNLGFHGRLRSRRVSVGTRTATLRFPLGAPSSLRITAAYQHLFLDGLHKLSSFSISISLLGTASRFH